MKMFAKVYRVHLNAGGYDRSNGEYFGLGDPVYRVEWWTEDSSWWKYTSCRAKGYQAARRMAKQGDGLPRFLVPGYSRIVVKP